jgi:hypothetical protein
MIQVSLLFHQLSWCLTLRFSGSPTQLTKQARYLGESAASACLCSAFDKFLKIFFFRLTREPFLIPW